jgi:hypothetical protein
VENFKVRFSRFQQLSSDRHHKIIKYGNCIPKYLIMKLPLLFIALLVQAASSDQINGEHLRANRRMQEAVSSSSSEETSAADTSSETSSGASLVASSGTMAETSADTSLHTSAEKHSPHYWKHSKKHSKKHGKKGSWKHSKKGSHKGKKHSKRQHHHQHDHHWDTSSSSSSSRSSADTAVEAVELELIDAEPELAMEPTEEVEEVSTKTYFAKTAEALASVLVGSAMEKPHVERTEKNHGN